MRQDFIMSASDEPNQVKTRFAPTPMAERPDWTSFRTVEGLQQKGGVRAASLRRLVMKELADNALDEGGEVEIGLMDDGETYFVDDDGLGFDGEPEEIADLFSVRRPKRSSKFMRMPRRGALGNGLRVVAGAVIVSEGSLVVITRNRRIVLAPQAADGSTRVVEVTPVDRPVGTRIEIKFGPALPDHSALRWAQLACDLAWWGQTYAGKSSPWWYDVPQFQELLYDGGDGPVSDLLARFDGGAKAAIAADLSRAACKDVSRDQAADLILALRAAVRPVVPSRLGAIGPEAIDGYAYAKASGVAAMGAAKPRAEIPFVVEAWAQAGEHTGLTVFVNRTPIAGEVSAVHDKRAINAFGCGLRHTIATAPSAAHFTIILHIVSPYIPITNDGKEPDLSPFFSEIAAAVQKAVRKARPPKEDDAEGRFVLPRRKKGRQSEESDADYQAQRDAFCRLIRQIRETMDFKVGSRGWCYILEEHGLVKGDFGRAENLITECRKSGELPLDICAEDDSRETIGGQEIDDPDIDREAGALVDHLINHAHESYAPIDFWEDLDVYVEVVVEKLDLRNLFQRVCDEFCIPITNFKGWSDLNARAVMMRRFAEREKQGKRCILLLCGDHDPGGLLITTTMRKNLEDLEDAVGWSPDDLIITRFGLNADFIERKRLTWIDNLETSSGLRLDDEGHRDHSKDYVQSYIEQFGARKCEANALVVRPDDGRDLCRRAILEHVPTDAPERYRERLAIERGRLREAIRRRLEER
jgi:hypothetical protein